MDTAAHDAEQAPVATAARIYDCWLGGTHWFPADREAAERTTQILPQMAACARANRAFLGRAVNYLAQRGIHQFLDLGSGLPTQGNVHEIAQGIIPDARVVYVDIDTGTVAYCLEILNGNPFATAIRGDVRDPETILDQVRGLLDFTQPIAVLLVAVLHFVPEDADGTVETLRAALAPGSHIVISHAATETYNDVQTKLTAAQDLYRIQTAMPARTRSREEIRGLLEGTNLVDPGVVWVTQWRPAPDDPDEFPEPSGSGLWAGVGVTQPI